MNGNNNIGADNTSQIIPVKNYSSQTRYCSLRSLDFDNYSFLLVLLDWYNPHPYHVLQEL